MKTLRKLNSAGDTIVEVLIAIAVASLALSGAFVVTSKTLKNAQQAREHAEALKLLEGQLEQVKALSKTPGNTVFTGASTFCISTSGVMTPIGASPPAACSFGAVPGGYGLSVTRTASNTFTARANWTGPTGGADEVSLIYRLYP